MSPRVLYVEDNLDNLVLVRRVLKAAGFELLEAMSAQEGIEIAEKYLPDLILMDINMPEMDGLTATMHLRQNPAFRDVPIVALTANVMRTVLEQVKTAGCDGYIVKPIQVDTFCDQLLSFLKDGKS